VELEKSKLLDLDVRNVFGWSHIELASTGDALIDLGKSCISIPERATSDASLVALRIDCRPAQSSMMGTKTICRHPFQRKGKR